VAAQFHQPFQQQRGVGFLGQGMIAADDGISWNFQSLGMTRDLCREIRTRQRQTLCTSVATQFGF
jgi:hypothetical protein